MRYLTLLTAFATFTGLVYSEETSRNPTCPRKGNNCNRNNKPSAPLIGKLKKQYSAQGYECSGTIEILNECDFQVKDFKFSTPKQGSKLEWFSVLKGADIGAGVNSLTELDKSEITVSNKGEYCWVNLNEDADVIKLIEDDSILICEAAIQKDSSGSGDSGSSSTKTTGSEKSTSKKTDSTPTSGGSGDSSKPTNTTTNPTTNPNGQNSTTTPSATSSPKPSTTPNVNVPDADDGALLNYIAPSNVFYFAVLVLSLYLFNQF